MNNCIKISFLQLQKNQSEEKSKLCLELPQPFALHLSKVNDIELLLTVQEMKLSIQDELQLNMSISEHHIRLKLNKSKAVGTALVKNVTLTATQNIHALCDICIDDV